MFVQDKIADMLTRIRNANIMKYQTVEVIGTKMTFAPRCEGCFALTYDPGVFLPNITLRLRKHMMASSYIKFKYESDSFFMLSAAQFFFSVT